MRFIQKAFVALCLTVASLSSQAFDLPVHHVLVMYSVDHQLPHRAVTQRRSCWRVY